MDPGGHLRRWLMRYFAEDLSEVRWKSRSTLWGVLPEPGEFVGVGIEIRLRLLRLIGALCDFAKVETYHFQFAVSPRQHSSGRADVLC